MRGESDVLCAYPAHADPRCWVIMGLIAVLPLTHTQRAGLVIYLGLTSTPNMQDSNESFVIRLCFHRYPL